MKFIWLTVGAIVGSFLTTGAIMATEIWREYRKANENGPWQEYSSEDKAERQSQVLGQPPIITWGKHPDYSERKSVGEVEPRTVFDLNQERMFKLEMYERDSEDDSDDNSE